MRWYTPLLEQKQFLHAHETPGFKSIEIHAAGQSITMENDLMIAFLLMLVHKLRYYLAECVVDGQRYE